MKKNRAKAKKYFIVTVHLLNRVDFEIEGLRLKLITDKCVLLDYKDTVTALSEQLEENTLLHKSLTDKYSKLMRKFNKQNGLPLGNISIYAKKKKRKK